jgi:sugar diacid utilization regulator
MSVVDRVETLDTTPTRDSSRRAALGSRLGAGGDSATSGRRRYPDACPEITRVYWPCLLSWVRGSPTDAELEQMRQAARRRDSRSMIIPVDRGSQVLLFAADSFGGPDRRRLRNAVSAVVEAAHAGRPAAEIEAVLGDRIGPGAPLALVASRLRRLRRYALAHGGDALIWARRDSLVCLLETIDPRRVSSFIQGQLTSLQAYDHEHGTNLQRVLELALDHSDRNTAARAAFMHRNTFRKQLRKALELIDVDFDCPEERLALHLALKLRALGPSAGRRGRRTGSGRPQLTLPN